MYQLTCTAHDATAPVLALPPRFAPRYFAKQRTALQWTKVGGIGLPCTSVDRHPFLSEMWIVAAREIHLEYHQQIETPSESLRMNVTVTGAPFSDEPVLGHVDTTSGSIVPNDGHHGEPDVSVLVPYEIARVLLIEQQIDVLMISFMSGEIEVEGDVTLLFALQDIEATPEQQRLGEEVAGRLREITA